MSSSKKRKEIDKAIRHLMDYIEKSDDWGPLFKQLMIHFCTPVASQLDRVIDTVIHELITGPYGNMAYGFLFEEMATTTWDNEGITPIDTFLKTRGWREGPAGRRYLRAMLDADLQFLEITRVDAGQWIEVRPFGTNSPPMRVVEHAASQSLHPWDTLLARVYKDGKSHRFTGALLPLDADASAYVQERLAAIPADLAGWYQELVDDGEDVEGIPVNFANEIPLERMTRLAESAFMCFAINALDPSEPVLPELFNTDNERVVMTRFRFPIHATASTLVDTLSAHPELVRDSDETLSWLKSDASKTVLGTIQMQTGALIFQTNSVERGEAGVHMIQSLLGELVGPAMGVHENLADLMDLMPPDEAMDPDSLLQSSPEVRALLQSHLTEHYRRTLDEPIPMLDNESPRACAADPTKHKAVVDWLKFLENSSAKAPGASYDTGWMWTELGLEGYKPAETDR